MKFKLTRARVALATFAGLAVSASCATPTAGEDEGNNAEGAASTQAALIGDHLKGISDADFTAALAAFTTVEEIKDGLGPIFNDSGCGNCHNQGASGGAGEATERRFGRFNNGKFDPLAELGGSLRQLKTLGNFTNGSVMCSVPLEVEPAQATVKNVGRLTTPLFGLGLVDAMPDSFFADLADSEPHSVRGTVNVVRIVLPDPSDPKQSIGSKRVGRFGWKGGVPNLVQFAADAYVNEMGITTQHCFKGTSVDNFATESAPNGVPVAQNCEDGIPGVDEPVGACQPGETEIQDDVAEFNKFMTFLSPPARAHGYDDLNEDASYNAPEGRQLFDSAGCSDCHTRKAFVTPNHPANGVPGKTKFFPFSDFLVHDMGKLGDRIGNAGDSEATTRLMRTAPLWGIRFRTKLLHDGRATDVPGAVGEHDGQGAAAAKAFHKLNSRQQAKLVAFVNSL